MAEIDRRRNDFSMHLGKIICTVLFLSSTALGQAADTDAIHPKFGSRHVRVHDPSTIIREGSNYWTFYTGRGTPSYRSTDLITWTNGPRVFDEPPPWVTNAVPRNRGGLDYWAPDIIKTGDRYLLYYSVSTFGRNTSAIALVSNPTLDPDSPNYKWTDHGPVIQSGTNNNFNAIDPAVTFDQQGKLWMSFGSFWSGIKMIEIDSKTGQRISPDSTIHSLAEYESIEAPFIYHHDKHYYLFVNWGRCCRGTNSTYNIRIGRAEKITGPYVDKEGKDLNEAGGTLFMETEDDFIGPGHAGIYQEGDKYWFSLHYYDRTRRGMSTLAIRPLTWEPDGWPKIHYDQ